VRESAPASFIARTLRGKKAGHTALDKGFNRRLARGIHNRLLQELTRKEWRFYRILATKLVRNLRSRQRRRADGSPALWAGQSANLSTWHGRIGFFDLIGRRDFLKSQGDHSWSSARREKQILNKEKREWKCQVYRQSCSNHRSQQRHWEAPRSF